MNPDFDKTSKRVKDFLKAKESILDKVYKFKKRLSLQTDECLEQKIRPDLTEQKQKFVENMEKGPKEIITPSSVFGIGNLGNTCFFNSTMQCLNATRPIVNYYLNNAGKFKEYSSLLSSIYFKLIIRIQKY